MKLSRKNLMDSQGTRENHVKIRLKSHKINKFREKLENLHENHRQICIDSQGTLQNQVGK